MKSAAVIYLSVLSLLLSAILSTSEVSMSKSGCRERCGDVVIPYPFGVGLPCSANRFFVIACENSTTPILRSIDREVLDLSVGGTIVIKQRAAVMECNKTRSTRRVPLSLWGSPFTISGRDNILVVVSCSSAVWLYANKTTILGGCAPLCDGSSTDTSCSGANCCHVTFQSRLKELKFAYKTIQESNVNTSFCGHVFGVDKKWLKNYKSYKGIVRGDRFDRDNGFAPLVLEWEYSGLKDHEDRNGKFKTRQKIIYISIGSSLVIAILLLVLWKSARFIGQQIEAKRKCKFFKRNGGLLLQQQLSSSENGLEWTKLYSSEELIAATHQYSEDQILGSGFLNFNQISLY